MMRMTIFHLPMLHVLLMKPTYLRLLDLILLLHVPLLQLAYLHLRLLLLPWMLIQKLMFMLMS